MNLLQCVIEGLNRHREQDGHTTLGPEYYVRECLIKYLHERFMRHLEGDAGIEIIELWQDIIK